MLSKVIMQSNGDYHEIYVDDQYVIGDDGISVSELLSRLSHMLGFEYEYQYGDWDINSNQFKAEYLGGN